MADPAAPRIWRRIPVALPDEGRTSPFETDGHQLLLCNAGGESFVVANRCPHAKAVLSGGRLCGFALECPLHGGKLDVRDGSPLTKPIRKPVRTFAVRRIESGLEVALPGER